MKSKIWIFQIPVVALFTWAFWVNEAGLRGEIENGWLRERLFPTLQTIHGQHTNLKFQYRGPQPPKNKIVIAEIDSDSIDKYGRWPWHRDTTGALVQSIFDAGAKHVGLDIVFSEPDRRVSDQLAQFLEANQLASKIPEFETDHFLENIFIFNSENVTLGWMSTNPCQPKFASFEGECPVNDPDLLAMLPKDMEKFALKKVTLTRTFDTLTTPLMTVPRFIANLPIYNAAATHAGFLQASPDRDGYIRRSNLVMAGADSRLYPSLPLSMAAMVLGEEISVKLDDRHRVSELRFEKSGRSIPVSPLGMMEVNFRGPAASFQYVKAMELMDPSDEIRIEKNRSIASVSKKELLKDAIVLIGVSAVGVFDMRAFPFDSNTPGVEGHANILDNLLSNDMLRHGDSEHGKIWMYLLMTLGALLFAFAVEKLESIPALLLFIGVMGGGFFVDQKVLFENNQNWNTSIFLIEIVFMFFVIFAVKYMLEEKNKKFIRGAFAKYVSPAIIDSIMKDPSKLTVGGEKKDLTILFSDIRSFTTFSEKMDAKQLATFLNDYLGKMTDLVFDTGGTLDKYIGDAVMAFWGAPLDQPGHAANACNAAIRMQQLLAKDRPYYREKYGIEVNIGIGINSGPVNVGNMGSERIFEYTVIGDHVNLASRLEGLTKEYHSGILTTRFTLDEIQKANLPAPPHRVLDFVKVKGKKVAVELIQILEREIPQPALDAFAHARQLYTQQKWDEAIAAFEAVAPQIGENGAPDEMCLTYIERCKEFKLNPPGQDWDGSWTMLTK